MIAIFYKMNCPPDVVEKPISEATHTAEITISPYEPLDDLNGYIKVSGTYDGYNYLVIKSLNGRDRYYYVVDREALPGGICRMRLSQDSLMTWGDVIMSTQCILGASNSAGNKDFPGNLPALCFDRNSEISSETSFEYGNDTTFDYVLVSASKGASYARTGGTVGTFGGGNHIGGGSGGYF